MSFILQYIDVTYCGIIFLRPGFDTMIIYNQMKSMTEGS